MSKKVLLVGCGQLGSRHLQAAASLMEINEIFVIDPSERSLELGKARIKEIKDLNPAIEFHWLTDFSEQAANGDLCIVATQAKGRSALIQKIASELGYKSFLIEKIVTQSITEYQELMDFAKKNSLNIWVNCKTRAYGVHKYIKSKLNHCGQISYADIGGNHGLANNGIHSADLFVFYDEAKRIRKIGENISPRLLTTKRGCDIYDLGGSLYGSTDNGSSFLLSFSVEYNSPSILSIVSGSARFIVDHYRKFAYESYEKNGWEWTQIPIEENWSVSFMSRVFMADILRKGTCDLPTLEDCFPAHEYILGQLLPLFSKLMKKEQKYCPVT